MNRTKVLMTSNLILTCVYVICLQSRICYADDATKDNGLYYDENFLQAEDDLNSSNNDKAGIISSKDSEKRASFSAWGGKRDGEISEIKRPKFAAWGGKRDGDLAQKYLIAKQMAKKPSFSSWGGKRSEGQAKRPSFNAWGGKRSKEIPNYEENDFEKRAKFMAWGGKRSDDSDVLDEEKRKFAAWGGKRAKTVQDLETKYKRPQFSAWGGKRSNSQVLDSDELEKRPQFSSWGGKRAKFNSWGGKRAKFNSWGGKRARFNSWGGKRSQEGDSDLEEMKRKFNSWGGKRADLEITSDAHDPKRDLSDISAENRIDLDMDKETPEHSIQKRSVRYPEEPEWKRRFNPWAGKRSTGSTNEELLEQIKRNFIPWGGKRAGFSAWGGKRAGFSAWGGKRAGFSAWGGKRAPFSAWGGKRTRSAGEDDGDNGKELLLYTLKRQSFRPWGGK